MKIYFKHELDRQSRAEMEDEIREIREIGVSAVSGLLAALNSKEVFDWVNWSYYLDHRLGIGYGI